MKFLLLIFTIFIYLYLNLGKYLDVTKKPIKTELIVVLGGSYHHKRVEKTIDLYQNGFLKGNHIILTGIKKLPKDLKKILQNNIQILINSETKNTMEEILYIKDFIQKKDISSVIFITTSAHSRRVKIFWENYGENLTSVKFNIVASELKFWNTDSYYNNVFSREYAFRELIKIGYNFFIYGILQKVGLKDSFESYFQEELIENKKNFYKRLKEAK